MQCFWVFTEREAIRESFGGWTYTCVTFIDGNRAMLREQDEFLHLLISMRTSSNLGGLDHRLIYHLLTFGKSIIRAMYRAESWVRCLEVSCFLFALSARELWASWTQMVYPQCELFPLQLGRIKGVHGKWSKIVVRSSWAGEHWDLRSEFSKFFFGFFLFSFQKAFPERLEGDYDN